MQSSSHHLLLNKQEILRKVRRIAYQIYEDNFSEKEIVLAGVYKGGYLFAKLLKEVFEEISPIQTHLVKITLDKKQPLQSEISLDCEISFLENKTVILIDDVLYTGRTLAYSLKPFLNVRIKKLQTAVIVNRSHTNFPISANYVGYALSTTLNNHIQVILDNEEKFGVYIS